jgi:hypothetical protein
VDESPQHRCQIGAIVEDPDGRVIGESRCDCGGAGCDHRHAGVERLCEDHAVPLD